MELGIKLGTSPDVEEQMRHTAACVCVCVSTLGHVCECVLIMFCINMCKCILGGLGLSFSAVNPTV